MSRHELLYRRISKLTEKTTIPTTIEEKSANEKEDRDSGQRAEASEHNPEEETIKLEMTSEEMMESLRLDEARGGDDDGREKAPKSTRNTKVGTFDVGKYFEEKKIHAREMFKQKYKTLPPKCKVCGYRGVRDERECYNYDKHYLLEKKK